MRSVSSRWPPGLPYVLQFLVARLTPLAAVVIAVRVAKAQGILNITTTSLAVAIVLGIPLLVVLRIFYTKLDLKRRAARLGAVIPPSREGKSFGNVDLLKYGIERWKNGYVGTHRYIRSPNRSLIRNAL